MKKIIYIFILYLLGAYSFAMAKDSNFNEVNKLLSIGIETVIIPTKGMTCMGCAAQIKDALRHIVGVENVEVDLVKRIVTIDYKNGNFNLETAVNKIKELGYVPEVPRKGKQ